MTAIEREPRQRVAVKDLPEGGIVMAHREYSASRNMTTHCGGVFRVDSHVERDRAVAVCDGCNHRVCFGPPPPARRPKIRKNAKPSDDAVRAREEEREEAWPF
jgi:hypothetical protein